MKIIKYKFIAAEVNRGTVENPQIEQIIKVKTIKPWSEEAEEIAKAEACNGEYTIEEVEESISQQIISLKEQLASTDYKAIKYAEGWITEEEYAPIREERQALRDKINELEAKLEAENNQEGGVS